MSRSKAAKVSFDDSIDLPANIAAAYRRNLLVLTDAEAFVDRAQYLGTFVDNILSWRFANVITNEQCSWMLRVARKTIQEKPGRVNDNECNTAEQVEAWQDELARRDVDLALATPS